MKVYQVSNTLTQETKYYAKKSKVARELGISSLAVKFAIMSGDPIKKRSGKSYKIYYRDVENVSTNEVIS